jgi:hypothetical protein
MAASVYGGHTHIHLMVLHIIDIIKWMQVVCPWSGNRKSLPLNNQRLASRLPLNNQGLASRSPMNNQALAIRLCLNLGGVTTMERLQYSIPRLTYITAEGTGTLLLCPLNDRRFQEISRSWRIYISYLMRGLVYEDHYLIGMRCSPVH